MSEVITVETSHQFMRHTVTTIEPGDEWYSWCSIQQDKTRHLWTGTRLICLECHPERDPRKQDDD